MTVSITVLICETTGAGQLVIPLMITIFFAKLVGDSFNESIYDVHIHIRGAPLLEEVCLFLLHNISGPNPSMRSPTTICQFCDPSLHSFGR